MWPVSIACNANLDSIAMTIDSPETMLKARELAATVGVALDPADLARKQQATREADHRAGLKAAVWYAIIATLAVPLFMCGFIYLAAHSPSTGLTPADAPRELYFRIFIFSLPISAIGGWVCGYAMTTCPTR